MKVGLTPSVKVVHDCKERVLQDSGYEMSYDKWLLQRAADITYPDTQVEDMMREFFKTAVLKYLSGHKATGREAWGAYRFLKRNRLHINKSRAQNKILQENWL